MANKLRKSVSAKQQHSDYKARFEKNKLAKIIKAVKNQPNNIQLKAVLDKALDKGIRYTSGRRSSGRVCKGLYTELGFEKNMPSENMKKGGLDTHWYTGLLLKFNNSIPDHGQSMRTQLEALGYKYVRKHKKTAR